MAVGVQHQRQVQVARGGQAQRALQQDLARSGVEQVGAADDVGDALVGVIHHHRQLVGPVAVGATQDEVADAITFPWGSLGLFGIDKVVTYHIDTPLYVTPFVWVLSKDKIASMSAAQKKVIDDHCTTEWAEKVVSPWADFEAAGRTKIGSTTGHEMVKLAPEQLDAWRKAVAPVADQWAESAKKAGADPKQVLDALHQSLVKYKSAL